MYTLTITVPTKKVFAKIKKHIEVVGGRIIEQGEEASYDPEFVAKIKSQENMTGVKIKASEMKSKK
jgi:hypothetical protein